MNSATDSFSPCRVPTSDTRLGKLAVDKLESSLAIFSPVALMGSSVVSVGAIGVGRVAVRLDSACICRASEARGSGVELCNLYQ